MPAPPQHPLATILRYPITGAIALFAIAATAAWWTGRDILPLIENVYDLPHQPWRLVTSIFLHVDPYHLVFNLY